MTIEIRPIHEAELPGWLDCVTTGFLERPDVDKIADEVRTHWDLNRALAAVEGGRIVGTARTWPTELTVPGNARIKAAALTAVTVRPTHRRRGLLRGLLAAEHAAARDRGEVASILYASEYPIYGRFGYGPATQTCGWTVDLAATGFHEAAGGRSGTVDWLPVDESAVDPIRDVFEAWRITQPGEIWRRPITWLSDLGLAGAAWGDAWKGFLVVHRDEAGTIDGYARYHADAKWEHRQPRHALIVDELQGLTGEAQAALWRFVAGVDLAVTIKAERRSRADRLPWLLTNARAAETFESGDGMWAKLHDIPSALQTRTYERTGSLVLEVVVRDAGEDDATARRVRVALDVSPDGARAVETDQSPDLTIDGSALGAAYLGGTRLRDAVLARGWDEHRPGALAEADLLLATRDAPWCSTFF
ncbi:MAG TPA: GNAT family N-acetyltransferase [Candidatus Limnocylindrales bacterium]|nr:GNAT family N-acetyltransferase [Candidatus Limnocylindrales bacterium]